MRGISLRVSSHKKKTKPNQTSNNKKQNKAKQKSKTSENDFLQRIWYTLALNPDTVNIPYFSAWHTVSTQ